MIDEDAIALLRHPLVPRPQPGLHVKHLDPTMRCWHHRQCAKRIPQDEQGIRFELLKQLIRLCYDIRDLTPITRRIYAKLVVRGTQSQVPKEEVLQLRSKVLSRMHHDVREIQLV